MTFYDLDAFARGFVSTAFDDARACGAAPSSDEFFTPEEEHRRTEGQSDGTIPSDSDLDQIPAEEIARAAAFCATMREVLGADLDAAAERPGYDLERAGHDLYLTVCGHGTGFWDREELDVPHTSEATGPAANAIRHRHANATLGDWLSLLCGRGEIYLYADGDADSFVLRFDCLYSSAELRKVAA